MSEENYVSMFDELVMDDIANAKYKFAKTMAHYNPHHYSLRETWGSDILFNNAVEVIRKHGVVETYGKYEYICLNYKGCKYWTMGAPVDETILINRKPLDGVATLDYPPTN